MELTADTLPEGIVRARLTGRLDTVGVDQVETRFNGAVTAADRDAIVDLAGVSFVSSMGVRLLITAARTQRSRNRRIVLYGATPLVASTLAMVALEQIVPIVGDEAAALRTLAGTG
jgi:anti-sigma B factor antagonist